MLGMIVLAANAQNLPNGIVGYATRITGNNLKYHSPLPNVTASLLVRSNIESPSIAWNTAPVPQKFDAQKASFVWMFGVDVDSDQHTFTLLVDDHKVLQFKNPASSEQNDWSVQGEQGVTMSFRKTTVDMYGDIMGYTFLTLPRNMITPGKPVKITIQGDQNNSTRWYMVFKHAIKEEMTAQQLPLVLRNNEQANNQVMFSVVSLSATSGTINIEGHQPINIAVNPGYNSYLVPVSSVDEPKTMSATLRLKGKSPLTIPFSLAPVRPWSIDMIQHTHTDIGYTRNQAEILPEHLRYIDYALDYCDLTDSYPDAAKFHWTCEASWAVREYLKRRPLSQINRLRKRVEEGRIEITGMFFNFSEIVDERTLTAQLKSLIEFRNQGIPVKTAMQNDVNGIGWSLADQFADAGIEYLVMGEHSHRALLPFDKPTTFWWESPSGKRVMAYRSEHYQFANTLGIHTGHLPTMEKNLFNYLLRMQKKEYPHNRIGLQLSGYVTDNSPPATYACDMVKAWNEKYRWPHIELTTAGNYMSLMKAEYGHDLPVHRAAWPDWWSDGCGSALREMSTNRTTQAEVTATNGLLAIAAMNGATMPLHLNTEMEAIDDAILFYDEHTYSAAECVTDPYNENSMVQWGLKSAYAWEGVKRAAMLREEAMGCLQPMLPRTSEPSVIIFNTLNFPRSGVSTLYIDHQILPPDKAFELIDDEGNIAPAQAMGSRSDGTYWAVWCDNLPAMGYRQYRIHLLNHTPSAPQISACNGSIQNKYYRITIDTLRGGVISWYDKDLNQELVDNTADWLPAQLVHEQIDNRTQLEGYHLDTAYRCGLTNIKVSKITHGPVYTSVSITGALPGVVSDKGVTAEIRLFNYQKLVTLHYTMVKMPIITPEAMYVAFPFDLKNASLAYDVQGGEVIPGVNQLAGTASDWSTMQSYVAVRNTKSQILFSSPQIPLIQLGGLNLGQFKYQADPQSNAIYSWVLNNYWVTNFPASQEGELRWSYSITSQSDASAATAARFGQSVRIPLPGRVLPGGIRPNKLLPSAATSVIPQNIQLVDMRPDANDIIFHLRETANISTTISSNELLPEGFHTMQRINALGQAITSPQNSILIKPKESCFIRIRR